MLLQIFVQRSTPATSIIQLVRLSVYQLVGLSVCQFVSHSGGIRPVIRTKRNLLVGSYLADHSASNLLLHLTLQQFQFQVHSPNNFTKIPLPRDPGNKNTCQSSFFLFLLYGYFVQTKFMAQWHSIPRPGILAHFAVKFLCTKSATFMQLKPN